MPTTLTTPRIWLHRLAVLTAVSAFALLFIGGLVTSHQAGLSVPDWPTSYGWNMFTFPMKNWVGNTFYEHTHRLFASFVGFLILLQAVLWQEQATKGWIRKHLWTLLPSVAFYYLFGGGKVGGIVSMAFFLLLAAIQTVLVWRAEPKAGIHQLAWLAATGVMVQGFLGGITVIYYLPPLVSSAHAGLGQLVFCLTLGIAIITSRRWDENRVKIVERTKLGVRTLSLVTAIAILCQLLVGAVMRHTNSGLAIPTFPFAPNGDIIPEFTSFGVAINFTHRVGAVIVAFLMFLTARTIFKYHARDKVLCFAAVLSMFLLGLQIMLGAITIWTAKAVTPTTLHVSCGAAILGTMTFIMIIARHRLAPVVVKSEAPVRDQSVAISNA